MNHTMSHLRDDSYVIAIFSKILSPVFDVLPFPDPISQLSSKVTSRKISLTWAHHH